MRSDSIGSRSNWRWAHGARHAAMPVRSNVVHSESETSERCRMRFGQVVDGLDIVEKLGAIATDGQDRPEKPVVLKSVKRAEA